MVLDVKNENLILNICRVFIRSVDNVVDIPSLQTVYHTPSRISMSLNGSMTANGALVNKRIGLSYPGLAPDDFQKFNKLSKGMYQVYIELDNGETYEVASTQFPMSCDTSFDIGRGHELVFSSTAPADVRYLGTNESGVLEEMFDYDFDFNLA